MKLSIALCTYNGERYLSEQLQSYLHQTKLPDELIVSDDCSTDGTIAILNEFKRTAPFPVFVYRNASRMNYNENFLACVQKCSGDIIALSDQDDVWLRSKLQAAYTEMSKDADVTLTAHPSMCTDEHLTPSGVVVCKSRPGVFCHDDQELWFNTTGMAIAFRASCVKPWLELPRTLSKWGEGPAPFDEWIYFLASIQGKTALLSNYQLLYRRHAGTTTGDPRKTSRLGYRIALLTGATDKGYDHLARVAASRSEMSLQMFTDTETSCRSHLARAAQYYGRIEQIYRKRAQLYGEAKATQRVRCLRSLIGLNAYRPHGKGLGRKALLKDCVIALLRPPVTHSC